MASVTPPKPARGAALRQAMREKTIQDLVYRTEYLATLACNQASLDVNPDQQPSRELVVSAVPQLADAATQALHLSKHAELFHAGGAAKPWRPVFTPNRVRPLSPASPLPVPVASTGVGIGPWVPTATARARIWGEPDKHWEEKAVYAHNENLQHRLDKFHGTGMRPLTERRRPDLDRNHLFHSGGTEGTKRLHRDLVRPAFKVAEPASAVDPLHGRSNFGDVLQGVKTMVSNLVDVKALEEKQGAWAKQCDPLNTIKVQRVSKLPFESLGTDYMHVAETELREHSSQCRHVELLDEAWKPDLSATGLNFSRFYWRQAQAYKKNAAPESQIVPADAPLAMARLRRVDGHDEFSAHRFSLVEGGTVVLRQEGNDPFHNRALVVGEQPLPVLPQGHYMEVQVLSLFKTKGPPHRPRELDPRHRTEGLVLGFTKQPLERFGQARGALGAVDLPSSWSVSTSGTLYITPGSPCRSTKPAGHERTKEPALWHRHTPASATTPPCHDAAVALKAPLPPNSPDRAALSGGSTRRQLGWSIPIAEGDTVGLLATTLGGLVLYVNGRRELMVPDAGVPVACEMYPIIEAYNHIRSVRLVVGASPPS